jgi:hypothetical protein
VEEEEWSKAIEACRLLFRSFDLAKDLREQSAALDCIYYGFMSTNLCHGEPVQMRGAAYAMSGNLLVSKASGNLLLSKVSK